MWIPRPADEALATLLADERVTLVTVFGIGGSGSSATVERAVGPRALRLDLGAVTQSRQAAERLASVRARLVWLDQVHHPEAVRDAADALSAREGIRVVVAARAPLGATREHRVPLGPLPLAGVTALLGDDQRRKGLRPPRGVEELAQLADGWPLAARALVLEATLGAGRALDPSLLHTRAAVLGRVLDQAWAALEVPARALLVSLAVARRGLLADELLGTVPRAAEELSSLVDRGWVLTGEGRARVLGPARTFVLDRATTPALRKAKARGDAIVLAAASRARDEHRRAPAESTLTLERLRDDLLRIAGEAPAEPAVLAALCLEPVLVGSLDRAEALSVLQHAAERARRLDPDVQARVTLALARTFIHRGEHESAERALNASAAIDKHPAHAAQRTIYLAHIAAWRTRLDEAARLLDEAEVHIAAAGRRSRAAAERERVAWLGEDVLAQRAFAALERGELDEAEALARACATAATAGPSPRLGAIARRVGAEVLLRRGEPAAAVPLFERTRDELLAFGDRAGWLFVWGRMAEALGAAKDPRAASEARAVKELAARAGEGLLELTVLGALDGEDAAVERVGELAWRAQIPSVREQAQRWVAARGARGAARSLRLDLPTRRATVAERSVSLATRMSLWRVLVALTDAHARSAALSNAELFRAGWPGERVERTSQRKRVQTAIWTLRRTLLGDALATRPEGYALEASLRVERNT